MEESKRQYITIHFSGNENGKYLDHPYVIYF